MRQRPSWSPDGPCARPHAAGAAVARESEKSRKELSRIRGQHAAASRAPSCQELLLRCTLHAHGRYTVGKALEEVLQLSRNRRLCRGRRVSSRRPVATCEQAMSISMASRKGARVTPSILADLAGRQPGMAPAGGQVIFVFTRVIFGPFLDLTVNMIR